MHYLVNFLHIKKGYALAVSPPSVAHFETDGGGMIPNIGDVIHIGQSAVAGLSGYRGTVTNRMFSYINAGNCEVSVIFNEYHGPRNGE